MNGVAMDTASGVVQASVESAMRDEAASPLLQRPLRFAVLCLEDGVHRWEADCIHALANSGDAELVAVVVVSVPPTMTMGAASGPLARVDPLAAWPGDLRPHISRLGFDAARWPAELDFVLLFLDDTAMPSFKSPPLGSWCLRVGEGAAASQQAGLPGIIGTARGAGTMRVEVTARGGSMGEAGRVLHRLVLRRRRSHRHTLHALAEAAPGLCVGAARRCRRGSLPAEQAVVAAAPPMGVVRGALARFHRAFHGAAQRLLWRDIWSIGILPVPMQRLCTGEDGPLPAPRWLPKPRAGRFHADPFPLLLRGQPHLLFEMYDAAAGRGWIAATPIDCGTAGENREDPHGIADAPVALDLGCHMSYPAVFEFEGATYCTPEVCEIGGLRLFRLGDGGPGDWVPVPPSAGGLALEDVALVDPTIFEHEGRWWLMGTIQGAEPEMHLHAWHAPSPFGPWAPHALNPIKSDIGSARPAGAVFRIGEALYRPGQDCVAGYGSAVVLHRILRLDPEGFDEVAIRRIEAGRDWPYPHGLHTVNALGECTIIDAKRHEFAPVALLARVAAGMRGATARLTSGIRPERMR